MGLRARLIGAWCIYGTAFHLKLHLKLVLFGTGSYWKVTQDTQHEYIPQISQTRSSGLKGRRWRRHGYFLAVILLFWKCFCSLWESFKIQNIRWMLEAPYVKLVTVQSCLFAVLWFGFHSYEKLLSYILPVLLCVFSVIDCLFCFLHIILGYYFVAFELDFVIIYWWSWVLRLYVLDVVYGI